MCGLSGHTYSETYQGVDLFLYLVGSGATRTLYVLTGYEQKSQAFLFDIRVQADLSTLLREALSEQVSADDQVAAAASQRARQILDAGLDRPRAHYELEVRGDRGMLGSTLKAAEK